MKATSVYKGIALIGATALLLSAAANVFTSEDDKYQEKEDSKYHLTQDGNHKEPVKMKMGEEIAVQQRKNLKKKWEYGLAKSSSQAPMQRL